MRKLALIICLFLYGSGAAFSQMQKDKWIVNGALSFFTQGQAVDTNYPDYQHYKSNINSGVALSPGFGYFVSDRTVLGFSGHFGKNWSKAYYDNGEVAFENSWSSFGGGVFMRNYFPISEKVAGFGEFGMRYLKNEYLVDEKTYNLDYELGVQYLVSKKIAVHVGSPVVYYKSSKRIDTYSAEYRPKNEFSFLIFDSFKLGATIFL